jgi:NADH:ubiquinone oxidoreductase subunit 4 (subunit M)
MVSIDHFLTPICILVGWHVPVNEIKAQSQLKMYCLIWLILETILLIVFTVRDLLVFYIFLKLF